MTSTDYLVQLQALLPQGGAWPRDRDSPVTKLLAAWAEELARIDAHAINLIDESDPRTTYELMPDWERVAGLPDPCTPASASVEARRISLVQRLTMQGGASRAYFIALADRLGYPNATVTEFPPFRCLSECDDALNPAHDYWCMECDALCDESLATQIGWTHVWQLNLAAARVVEMLCTAPCDGVLRTWGDETIECVVRRLRPAQTFVIFSYGA